MSSKVTRLIKSAKSPSALLYVSIISTAYVVPVWFLAVELLIVCAAHLLAVPCVSSTVSKISNVVMIKWLAGNRPLPEERVVELTKIALSRR